MDEFGMGSASAFSWHGPAYNPYSADWAIARASVSPHPESGATARPPDCSAWLTPGGSSGGAAALVAAGAVAGALGTDTGGSVRQPASFCGVVGFKPSYGRVPRWGLIPFASSLDTVGFLTRTVSDAALMYDALAGPDIRDDTCVHSMPSVLAPSGRTALADLLRRESGAPYAIARLRSVDAVRQHNVDDVPLRGIRVGIPKEYALAEVTPAVGDAWLACASYLAERGASLVSVSLPHTRDALPAYYVVAPAEASSNLARYDGVRYGYRSPAGDVVGDNSYSSAAALHSEYTRTRSEAFGAEVHRRILAGSFVLSAAGRNRYYDAAVEARHRVKDDFFRTFRPSTRRSLGRIETADIGVGVDVLLTPTSPALPWLSKITATQPPEDMYASDIMTIPASLAGLPAISVPVGLAAYPQSARIAAEAVAERRGCTKSRDALVGLAVPIGVQLIGRYLDEDTVLHVASVLEAAARFVAPVYVSAWDSSFTTVESLS